MQQTFCGTQKSFAQSARARKEKTKSKKSKKQKNQCHIHKKKTIRNMLDLHINTPLHCALQIVTHNRILYSNKIDNAVQTRRKGHS